MHRLIKEGDQQAIIEAFSASHGNEVEIRQREWSLHLRCYRCGEVQTCAVDNEARSRAIGLRTSAELGNLSLSAAELILEITDLADKLDDTDEAIRRAEEIAADLPEVPMLPEDYVRLSEKLEVSLRSLRERRSEYESRYSELCAKAKLMAELADGSEHL